MNDASSILAAFGEGVPLPSAGPYIGIDEAGRGCLAGPVVAAAVLLPEGDPALLFPGMTDSKKLSAAKREKLEILITEKAVAFGVGLAWQEEIDEVNILNATFRAMSRAVADLCRRCGASLPLLVVDGNHTVPQRAWDAAPRPPAGMEERLGLPVPPQTMPPFPHVQKAVVDGDALVPAVAAASILAKCGRDRLMTRLDADHPGYGFAAHKGYGVKAHLEALGRLGPCPLHRKTFRKVRPEAEQALLPGVAL